MARALDSGELVRLEQARVALRRSARSAMFVGFVMPGVIAVAVIVAVVANPAFAGVQGWVGVLLSVVATASVFTAPMLLGKQGRMLSRYFGLRRDTAQGLHVVQKMGEVSWGAREHAYVAIADGRRLASAFFTQYEAIPYFWERFDQLPPGRYEFERPARVGVGHRRTSDAGRRGACAGSGATVPRSPGACGT